MRAFIAGCTAGLLAVALLAGCTEAPESDKSGRGALPPKPSGSSVRSPELKAYTYAAFEELLAGHKGKVVLVDMWAWF